jgi:uncharacterized Zn finger protein
VAYVYKNKEIGGNYMAECLVCGKKVKHQWDHPECQVRHIIVNNKDTALYNWVKEDYKDLVKKIEEELNVQYNNGDKG